jgi:putative ABC transport system permease protein
LGLFGLSSFTTKKRTKEIGIRKVLGAPILNLIVLLTREFLLPVGLACCIALPVSYFAIQKWLTGYAFHMDLSGWLFIAPVFLVLVIALLTISVQTVRTAATNPVESLRTE